MRAVLVIFILAALALPAFGEDYPDASEVEKTLTELASAREEVVLTSIGTSREGRLLSSVRIALPGEKPKAERPRLLIVAGLSPDHRIGTAVALRLGQALIEKAKEDQALGAALLRYTVEIIPLVNPDGLSLLLAGPSRDFRVNSRPVDDDRDGAVGEDPPDDLNGDGMITLMRVRDPAGNMRESGEDGRLMVPANRAAGERGGWRVLTEGIDNDCDGEINEDGAGGVDLDRNFAHGWQPDRSDAGRSCPSEAESRALVDYVLATPQIAAVLVYGHDDSLVAAPAANKSKGPVPPTGPPADDLPWVKEACRLFVSFTKATGAPGPQATGSFRQWAYYQAGLPAFSTPLWYPADEGTPFKLPGGNAPTTAEGRLLALVDREGKGFVEWAVWEHPTLGVVEIGGFDPEFLNNPPPRLIPRLVEEQVQFITALLGLLPRPEITAVSTRATGPGVHEVKLTVVNEALVPAVTAMGRITRAPMPLRLEVDLPPERLLQGRARELIERLDGSGGAAEFRWLIRGQTGEVVVIRLVSARCGDVMVKVVL